MKYLIFFTLVMSVLLSGCATILSPGSQDINISTPNSSTKVYIDSNYIGKGLNILADVNKDLKAKQMIFETDSCKNEYRVMIQDSRAFLYYVSWIPFGVFFLYPPMADYGNHSWVYEDNFSIDKLVKYNYWNSSKKRMIVHNVASNIKKENHLINSYTYGRYIDNEEPYKSKQLDSLKFRNTIFEDDIHEILRKTQYTDTTYQVFIDNLNTVTLTCVFNKLVYMDVTRLYRPDTETEFLVTELSANWIMEDPYGDTLYSNSNTARSGEFSLDYNQVEDAYKNSIADAVETSFWKFLDNPKAQELLNYDTTRNISFDKLIIQKPTKNPTNIDQAMDATVTIKRDDGGHGSGFLISHDGYIITNHHVITGNKKLTVILHDGRKFDAKLIRSNKVLDLALIKIEGNYDYAFTIPAEKNFSTGQDIFAIGTPESIDLGQSVSKGIVSNLRKHNDFNFIQIDVKVNHGNSGGSLVTTNGELIGVIEYKIVGVGVEGLSFSIPAFDIMKGLSINY